MSWRSFRMVCLICREEFYAADDCVCLPCQFGDGITTTARVRAYWAERQLRASIRELGGVLVDEDADG